MYLPLPQNRITNHLLTTLTWIDKVVAIAWPPERHIKHSVRLEPAESTKQEESSACFFASFPGLTWCDNSLQISFSLTECLPPEWDGLSGLLIGRGLQQQERRRCSSKMMSLPLSGHNKTQVYLVYILRSGLVCCDYEQADSSSFPAPSRSVLFTRWAV